MVVNDIKAFSGVKNVELKDTVLEAKKWLVEQ